MKKIIVILSMMFLLLGVGYAGATTIGFEEFSAGTVISGSGVFSDVVFSQGNTDGSIQNVLEVYNVAGYLGPQFSGNMAVASTNFDTPYGFRVDFLISGVNYVSVVLGDHNFDIDKMHLAAFDANDTFLDQDEATINWTVEGGPILEVTSDKANIAYVKFVSNGYDATTGQLINYNSIFFDNFTYTTVPEPATLLLLGFGLVGIAGIRRKLKK